MTQTKGCKPWITFNALIFMLLISNAFLPDTNGLLLSIICFNILFIIFFRLQRIFGGLLKLVYSDTSAYESTIVKMVFEAGTKPGSSATLDWVLANHPLNRLQHVLDNLLADPNTLQQLKDGVKAPGGLAS